MWTRWGLRPRQSTYSGNCPIQRRGTRDASLPALALSLANLAGLLSDLGQHKEALVPGREAEDLYREVADQENGNPAYLPALSKVLANISKCLSELGEYPEALSAAEEAVRLSQKVADADLRAPAVAQGLPWLQHCSTWPAACSGPGSPSGPSRHRTKPSPYTDS